MEIGNMIVKLRNHTNMSQEQFAELLGVTRQAVQKWEKNQSVPELEKLVKISKYFDVSLDSLVFESDTRVTEELNFNKIIKPKYADLHEWESYSSNLPTEFTQCTEEGLDIAMYEDLFNAVSRLPNGEIKTKLGDILFDIVINAKTVNNYKYIEPSNLEEIKNLRKNLLQGELKEAENLEDKVHGAWLGRICGCLLGKTVEGVRTDELIPFLKETDNFPMHRYILSTDINDEIVNKYKFRFSGRCFADKVDGMPVDDDTNYLVLAQYIIEKYGRNFTSYDVSRTWLALQSKDAYCTAERVAFCNFVKGFAPPESAIYKNPYREWIGAQIRGDYFGYINPANPETAAEMAFRDACISHTKNGIYGEMFVAAMIATAASTNCIKDIILGGLSQIPHTSRLFEAVMNILNGYENGVSAKECFEFVHNSFDEYTSHGWCHVISNAMIVTAALLYGEGDFGKSVCMAVETGFDTDCNGATVGSVLGMANGKNSLDSVWTKPLNDKLNTSVFGIGTVKISDCVNLTMNHIFGNEKNAQTV